MSSDVIINGPPKSKKVLLMAHGAGAPMDSDWMNEMAEKCAAKKIKVIRFNFPYMAESAKSGKKRPPNPAKQLLACWKEMIETYGPAEKLVISGKSMGGRMGSLIAEECHVRAWIGLGFPFYAPGKDPGDRIHHLSTMKTPALILQGERDSMGNLDRVTTFKLSKKVQVKWVPDGDHSFKPKKSSGRTLDENLELAAEAVNAFMTSL
jgi:predicted alpha/beta-hydrolase family hydrolase